MAGGIGICNVDLKFSTITQLACPECGSSRVACQEVPHAHLCLTCSFGSVIEDEEYEDEEE